jgi:hypothetical protein
MVLGTQRPVVQGCWSDFNSMVNGLQYANAMHSQLVHMKTVAHPHSNG